MTAKPKYLSREDVLNADDMATEVVKVPEWGGSLCVKTLSGKERDKFEASIVDQHAKQVRLVPENFRAKLVAATVVVGPDDTTPLFTEKDLDVLGAKSAPALQRVYDVASRLAGLSDADAEELLGN